MAIVNFLNGIIWGSVLVYGLLGVGIFFTLRLGGIQFIHFGEYFRSIKSTLGGNKEGISPLQALNISLASRIGTGNLAGVAVAIYLGGPGAIFWMWMVALVGMATAYAESTLAQAYKVRNADNQFRGGPAFYMQQGLGSRAMGILFAICLIVSFGSIFSAVQSNAIADAMVGAFEIPKLWTGIAVAVVTGAVIFGGMRAIANVANKVVPVMTLVYVTVAVIIICFNITQVPATLALIVKSAFGLEQAAGGATGGMLAALMNGLKRGLYSNEAGMGSAPNIAAAAVPKPHHPASQGFVQGLGVFIDTIVICTATALMILLSGMVDYSETGATGMQLTQLAMSTYIGDFGASFIALAIMFFAFTSIIAFYSYAESAMEYMGWGRKQPLFLLKAVSVMMVVWGAVQPVQEVFNIADMMLGFMAIINLIAIVLLSKQVSIITKDYFLQRKLGKEPVFIVSHHPELKDKVDKSIWDQATADAAELK